jgi:hypothetical protein
MNNIARSPDGQLCAQPRLRLVHDAPPSHRERRHDEQVPIPEHDEQGPIPEQDEQKPISKQATAGEHRVNVLIAGARSETRSKMLGELRNLLPASTQFVEACETWEMLACAATCRMVLLTDELGGVSSESLVRLLGRRHPTLPVLAVGNRAHRDFAPDLDVTGV